MNSTELVDAVFDVALGSDVPDTDALWISGITLLADVLLHTDEVTRERLLRGLTHELRSAMRGIDGRSAL